MVDPSRTEGSTLGLGSVVDGRYEVRARIGSGAMGTVYRVLHTHLERTFAMKVMKPQPVVADESVLRFQREARAAASIGHPNIVDVTDMGQLPDGTAYIVQELLHGRDLAACVEQEGAFDVDLALHVTRQICAALEAVHTRRIVHRDLKPENVMLVRRGDDPCFVKVLDFGICTLLEPAEEGPYARLTRTNVTLGTPMFMAPEQFSPDVQPDPRTDIHAVGAVLYFLLTERPLYHCRDLRHLCMRITTEPLPSVRRLRPDVPEALEAVFQRACAKAPEDRYASCAEMARALDEVGCALEGDRVSRTRPRLGPRKQSPSTAAVGRAALEETRASESSRETVDEAQHTQAHSFLRQGPSARHIALVAAAVWLLGLSLWAGRRWWPVRAAPGQSQPSVEGNAPATAAAPRDRAVRAPEASGREASGSGAPAPAKGSARSSARSFREALPDAPSESLEPAAAGTSGRGPAPRASSPGPPAAHRRPGKRARSPAARAPDVGGEAGSTEAREPAEAEASAEAAAAPDDEPTPAEAEPSPSPSPYRIPSRGLREVFQVP